MPRSTFRFSYPFRVRYSEVDGQRIVFNAHYLTYFDTAITEYFRVLPYDYMGQVERIGEDFHTVKTLVEYKQPIVFDQDIDVMVRASRLGRTSLTFEVEIHPRGADDLLASGEVVWVNVDQSTHTTSPIPTELSEKLTAYEGDALTGG
jgi:acyl-CoA thioester hydrolase